MSQNDNIFFHKERFIIDDSLSNFNQSKVNAIFEDGFKKIVFTEKSILGFPPEYVQKNFDPKKFYIQFALWADPKHVFVPSIFHSSKNLRWRESENRQEAITTFKNTVVPYFNQTWAHYLPQSFLDHYEDCYPMFDDHSSLIITHNDKLVATALMLEGFKNYLDESVTQLGWIFIAPDLEKEKRMEAQAIISNWIRNKTVKQIQAAVHLYNERSLRCLQRMGFQIKCLSIVRK